MPPSLRLPPSVIHKISVADPNRYLRIIKHLARRYGRAISGSFVTAPSSIWGLLNSFAGLLTDTGFLSSADLKITLNLFVRSFDFCCQVVKDEWCQRIGRELTWRDGYFYHKDTKMRVITIPTQLQYSAESVSYHFRNRFAKIYDKWVTQSQGHKFTPKHLIKPKKEATDGQRNN